MTAGANVHAGSGRAWKGLFLTPAGYKLIHPFPVRSRVPATLQTPVLGMRTPLVSGGSRGVRDREPGAESDPRVLCALQWEDARSRSEGSERCLEEVETAAAGLSFLYAFVPFRGSSRSTLHPARPFPASTYHLPT